MAANNKNKYLYKINVKIYMLKSAFDIGLKVLGASDEGEVGDQAPGNAHAIVGVGTDGEREGRLAVRCRKRFGSLRRRRSSH